MNIGLVAGKQNQTKSSVRSLQALALITPPYFSYVSFFTHVGYHYTCQWSRRIARHISKRKGGPRQRSTGLSNKMGLGFRLDNNISKQNGHGLCISNSFLAVPSFRYIDGLEFAFWPKFVGLSSHTVYEFCLLQQKWILFYLCSRIEVCSHFLNKKMFWDLAV